MHLFRLERPTDSLFCPLLVIFCCQNSRFCLFLVIFYWYNSICFSFMPGWHSVLMRWLSSMLTNALYVRSQPGTDYFVMSLCCCVWLLASLCYQEYSCMGELSVWIVFPTVAICMYRSSALVPLDSCLTAVACLSSAY